MEEQILVGSLDSGEGLKLEVAIEIQDEQGEGMAVAQDLMDMLNTYIDGYQDEDIVTQLRQNLAGARA